jgi:tetratricopeptide (TPR) repeat protein
MKKPIGIVAVAALCLGLAGVCVASDLAPNEVRRSVAELCDQGKFTEATDVAMKGLLDARTRFGAESDLTAEYLTIASEVARRRGKFHLAEKLYAKAVRIQAASSADEAPGRLSSSASEQERLAAVNAQVYALCERGEFSAAVHSAMAELLRVRERYGNSHPYTAQWTLTVADVARTRGKFYLAAKLYNKALAMLEGAAPTVVSGRPVPSRLAGVASFPTLGN